MSDGSVHRVKHGEAIRCFQASWPPLAVDGDAGAKTREKLEEALAEIEGDAIVGALP